MIGGVLTQVHRKRRENGCGQHWVLPGRSPSGPDTLVSDFRMGRHIQVAMVLDHGKHFIRAPVSAPEA